MKVTRMEKARQILAEHPEFFGETMESALKALFDKALGHRTRQEKWVVLREIANLLGIPNEERQESSELWLVCNGVRNLIEAKNKLSRSGIKQGDQVSLRGKGPWLVRGITANFFLLLEGRKGSFSPDPDYKIETA